MKTIVVSAILFAGVAFSKAQGQTINQNFNSGDRNAESANCWYTPGSSFTNIASEIIEGTYTCKTGQLTGGTANPNGVISPWAKLTGGGTITFKHRIAAWSSGISYRKLYVSLESATNQGVQDTLYQYTYTAATATTVRTETINIPAYTADKVYRIRIFGWGSGGTARLLIDDVTITGTYWSSPANGCIPLPVIQDADGDGVADDQDAYPNDKYRAYNTAFPSKNYGTLMFEDLWPSAGDYDFNDLVLNYKINTVTNASNEVVEVQYNFITKAIGGSYKNGFAFQLDGIPSDQIIKVGRTTAVGSLFSLTDNGTENKQEFANIPVYSNAFDILTYSGGGIGVNINPEATYVTPVESKITIVFMENGSAKPGYRPINIKAFDQSIFNPYITVNLEREKEVHLADKKPSSLANKSYFATLDDNSDLSNNRFYKTKNNLPWALDVAIDLPYTKEGIDITKGHLKLASWAKSGGAIDQDWYLDLPGNRDYDNLYKR